MQNCKANASIPGIITKVVLCGCALVLTTLLVMGKSINPKIIAMFYCLVFLIQFIDTMLGSNPIGMVIGAIVSVFCLIVLKTVYSYPASWLGQFFIHATIFLAPALAITDILRDIID